MTDLALTPYRTRAPLRVIDGFGRSVRAACRYVEPRSVEDLAFALKQAQSEGLTVGFRGAGRSYGDAALNTGGMGMLGAVTRVKLKLKKVDSGNLRVESISGKSIDALFDAFEQRLSHADYLVGWVDCLARGKSIGRGIVHSAHYLHEGEDPNVET